MSVTRLYERGRRHPDWGRRDYLEQITAHVEEAHGIIYNISPSDRGCRHRVSCGLVRVALRPVKLVPERRL